MELFANIALGWSPILGVVSTNGSNILKVVGWTGGVGSIPATGVYVGSSGYVTNITDGIDIRGASGAGAAVIFSAGASSAGLASIIFSNSNGVAFGLNGSVVTASYTQAAQSSLIFSNTNGITFGTNAGTLTASVATNYQSQGAYLTTAQPIGAYLTTAMLSNASTLSNINVSIGTTSSNLSQIVFSNVNNISFGINGGTITGTASFSQSVQTQGTFPGSTVFSNSNGVSFGLVGSTITATVATNYQSQGAYLTTAMQSNAAVLSNINVSAGTLSRNISNLIFSNSNNLSFGFDGTVLTGSAAGFTQSVQTNNLVTLQGSTGPIVFSNSNGVSFGGNNGTITASVNAGAQTSVVFSNFNGVTFGLAGSTLTASVKTDYQSSNANYLTTAQPVGAYLTTAMLSNASTLSNIYISAGTTQSNLSALVFSNSNNVSFGLNGSVVTGTASFNQSVQTQGTFPGATVFSNSNGVTFGLVGSTITASVSQSVQTQGTFPGATVFSNSNGVSFGLNGSTVTATVATNYQSSNANYLTSQSNQAFSASGGSSAFQTLNFANSNGFTFSNTNGSVIGSYTVPSIVGLLTGINVSGGTTSNNLSAITFSNVNGVSFGLNGSVLTASVAAAGGAQTGVSGISAGTTIMTSGTAVFSNSNGITFGLNGNTITATVATNYQSQGAYLTTAMLSNAVTLSNINISAGSTSGNLSALTFTNANGVTFQLNGGVVSASVATNYQSQGAYLTTAALSQNTSNYAGINSAVTGASLTVNTSGISLNLPPYITTQSGQAFSAPGGSSTFQTLVFANSNGVSWSNSNGSVVGSVQTNYQSQGAYLTTAMASNAATVFSNSNNVSFGLAGSTVTATASFAQSNQNISLYAVGNTTGNSSTVLNANSLVFSQAGGATFGFSAGSIILSDATGGGGGITNINVSAGTTSGNLSNLIFSNLNGVSFGLNGSTITASAAGGGGGGGVAISASDSVFTSGTISFNNSGALTIGTGAQAINFSVPATSVLSASGGIILSTNGNTISIGGPQMATLSRWEYPEGFFTSVGVLSQGTLLINHFYQPFYVTGTAMKIGGSMSAATNTSITTASANINLWMGIYTLSGSTLSLASSGSANNGFQWSVSNSSTANSSVNSMRQLTVPMDINMTPGEYWAAAVVSSQTTYTSYVFTLYGYSGIAAAAGAAVLTPIGLNTSANRDAMLFQGLYTAGISSGPQSLIGSNINNTAASAAMRANFYFAMYNGTY